MPSANGAATSKETGGGEKHSSNLANIHLAGQYEALEPFIIAKLELLLHIWIVFRVQIAVSGLS